MFNLQGSEIIVILLLALVVLGPEKLPDAIRRFSTTYAELKKMGSGFQSELKSALDEPMREMRETATLVQNAADPARIAAEAEAEAEVRRAQAEAQQAETERADAEAAAAAAAAAATPMPDVRPHGVTDPGSDTVAIADEPPVNQIAAANSSGAITAANERAVDEVARHADDGDGHNGNDVHDDAPDATAAHGNSTGPAFHSAAPPVAPRRAAEPSTDAPVAVPDDAGADVGPVIDVTDGGAGNDARTDVDRGAEPADDVEEANAP